MYGPFGNEMGNGEWVIMAIMMVLFWGGVVVVIATLSRRRDAGPSAEPPKPPHHDAERILAERFAHGDIDEAEFKARRAALRRP